MILGLFLYGFWMHEDIVRNEAVNTTANLGLSYNTITSDDHQIFSTSEFLRPYHI